MVGWFNDTNLRPKTSEQSENDRLFGLPMGEMGHSNESGEGLAADMDKIYCSFSCGWMGIMPTRELRNVS